MAYRYADEPFTITVNGINLESLAHIQITFRQGDRVVNISDPPVLDESHLTVTLSQQQTGIFKDGICCIQGNFFAPNGERKTSAEQTITMKRNLLDRVIVYD